MIHWVANRLSEELTVQTPARPGSREYIYARERMLERLHLREQPARRARQRRRPIRHLAARALRRLSALLASTAEWLALSDSTGSRGESLQ